MRSHADFALVDRSTRRAGRRARAAFRLVQTLALAAVVFLLFPLLYANAVPGDEVIVVPTGGTRVFQCEFTGQETLPGGTVYCNLRVGNGGELDGSFWIYSDETSLQVLDHLDRVVTDTALVDRFINMWFFHAYTKPVITRSFPEERDVTYDAQWVEVCAPRLLTSYDGGANPSNLAFDKMCPLGVIRGISSPRRVTEMGEPAYERQFRLAMTERDDGTDQSVFKGWGLKFDLIVRAKIPGDDTCPVTRVNGVCGAPVYQRP